MWKTQKYKYGNVKVINAGVAYDSKKEMAYASSLELLKRSGTIKDFILKPRYNLLGKNGNKICAIIPDFLIINNDESLEVHEVKSVATMTPTWKLKQKLFLDNYPEIAFKVV